MQNQVVKKPVRTISGVTPLTVVLKPRKCDHGTCIYCPGGDKVPQSYTDKSPAIMRASVLNYDAKLQVETRLQMLKSMNHPTDKIEIIILGGTFLQYPLDYQYDFIKKCYDALNGKNSKNLEEAKKINEFSKHRCVALCIENRPDNCSNEEIKRMLSYGCTRVEIGVQMPDDNLYKKTNRGHSVSDVIAATKKLKDAGFKIGYHIMPGLPYSNKKKDLRLFKKIFSSENFKPDQLKIYPCQIVSDSPLEKIYNAIKFKPYSEEETKKLLEKMLELVPEYCRVMRILREFPRQKLVSGLEKLGLRKDIENEFRKNKTKIKEIRMREIGFNKISNSNIKLKVLKYDASGGKEFFLEFVNKENILFGLLRLRIFEDDELCSPLARNITGSKQTSSSFSLNKKINAKNLAEPSALTLTNSVHNKVGARVGFGAKENKRVKFAVVRELHIYGQAINLGEKGLNKREGYAKETAGVLAQHKGIGKVLMEKAEEITRKNKIKKLSVISGIGVREYYRKLGYKLEGFYMVKKI